MLFLKKNYLFCFLTIFTLLAHQFIFQKFFPNNNSYLGHDYSATLPNFIFGKIWFKNNFLSIPWFSPSFCCGTPFFSDPQTMYYSFQQLFFIIFSPLVALKISFLFFSLIAFFGTFFLMYKTFKLNIYVALISAALFLFNGFFNYRAVIGHFPFLGYVFIPLYCYTLFNSFENNDNNRKSFFYLLISSILFATFVHSGSSSIIIVITLSIIFIVSIYTYINGDYKIIYNLLLSFCIGLMISLSKINASFAFVNNFTREYQPLVFENFFELLNNTFKSLFFYPDIDKFNSGVINKVTNQLQIHEIEFGVSVIPLIIFIVFFFNLKKFKISNFTFVKLLSLLSMFFIILLVTTINISNNEIGNFLRKLPVIKSTWVHYRLTSMYILPVIIISCILLDRINFKETYIKFFTCIFLVLIFFQNFYYKNNFYHNQTYDPTNIEKFHNKQNKIENISVKEILIFLDQNKKPVISNQRNDMFVFNFSPLFCYNPIFGYNLEKLPKNKFTFNSMNKINDNLISYKGNPKMITKYGLNFFNPSCFVFPDENNCIPGDLFRKNEIKELDNFLNYKKFKFNISKSQNIFNHLSVISLFLSIFYIMYYLIRKIIVKNLDE